MEMRFDEYILVLDSCWFAKKKSYGFSLSSNSVVEYRDLDTNQPMFCRTPTLFNKSAKVWNKEFNWLSLLAIIAKYDFPITNMEFVVSSIVQVSNSFILNRNAFQIDKTLIGMLQQINKILTLFWLMIKDHWFKETNKVTCFGV